MSKKILLVDDEPEVLEIFGKRLRVEGYETQCFGSGKTAVSAFIENYYENPFDVLLLDVDLPDISGIDILKTVRQEEEIRGINYDDGVKIIMQTGRKETWMEAFNRGCDDYIIKPYAFEDLLKKIKEKTQENDGGE